MGWLFGGKNSKFNKPVSPEQKVIPFPVVKRGIPTTGVEPSRATFTEVKFESVDEALWKVRADIRRGLLDPTAVLVVLYDKMRESVVWYQYGRENDDADEAFRAWIDEIMS